MTLRIISDVERHGNQHKIYKIRQYTMGLSTSRWQRFSAAANCYQSKFHIILSRLSSKWNIIRFSKRSERKMWNDLQVTEGSLAECMGLKVGDVIVRLNDQPVSSLTHGQAHEELMHAGNNFVLAIQR